MIHQDSSASNIGYIGASTVAWRICEVTAGSSCARSASENCQTLPSWAQRTTHTVYMSSPGVKIGVELSLFILFWMSVTFVYVQAAGSVLRPHIKNLDPHGEASTLSLDLLQPINPKVVQAMDRLLGEVIDQRPCTNLTHQQVHGHHCGHL